MALGMPEIGVEPGGDLRVYRSRGPGLVRNLRRSVWVMVLQIRKIDIWRCPKTPSQVGYRGEGREGRKGAEAGAAPLLDRVRSLVLHAPPRELPSPRRVS